MSNVKTVKKIERIFYLSCFLLVVYSGYSFLKSKINQTDKINENVTVTIQGTVNKPGKYKIPLGSTVFDVLKVAGVQSNSDLRNISASKEIKNGDIVNVNKLSKNINVTLGTCNLSYYKGSALIKDLSGNRKNPSIGVTLQKGDLISTMDESQMLLDFNDGSQIALNTNSSLLLNKISNPGTKNDNTEILIKKGHVWANIKPQHSSKRFYFITPHLSVVVRGTEFIIDVDNNGTEINLLNGLLYIEDLKTKEGVNLVAGQKVLSTINNAPLNIEKSTQTAFEYKTLQKESDLYYKKHKQYNILFCGTPSTYKYINMNPTKKKITILNIPPNTWVGDFVEGFNRFDRSFLYGGGKFTASVAEKIIKRKIDNLLIYDAGDISKLIEMVDGLELDVDAKAAKYLKINPGTHHLEGMSVVRFMNPNISGSQDGEKRQSIVLNALFKDIKNKNIILSTSIIARATALSEGDMSSSNALGAYSVFNSIKGWNFKTASLPGKYFTRDGETYLRASQDQIDEILN